jgi:YHS domain-containing protein
MFRFTLLVLALGLTSCDSTAPRSAPAEARSHTVAAPAPAARPSNGLTVVRERNYVCMVNDQFMGREQIPVTIGEQTYYGCCPMCKDRLASDASLRTAKDPVSGKAVDKASAVIGQAPSGNVLYFESEATLAAYRL